jgi:hypothetical protein
MVLVDMNEAAEQLAQRPSSDLIPAPAADLFGQRPAIVEQMEQCRRESVIHTERISDLPLFDHPPQDFEFTYTYLLNDLLLLRTVPLGEDNRSLTR